MTVQPALRHCTPAIRSLQGVAGRRVRRPMSGVASSIRRAPQSSTFEVRIDFLYRTYGELIKLHGQHPDRKFGDSNGQDCTARKRSVLQDLPVRVGRIKHVGKEGNELDTLKAGTVDKSEWQLEYHDSWFENLIVSLRKLPTKVIAEATGYNERTVGRLKRGEVRPSPGKLSKLSKVIGSSFRPGIPLPRYGGTNLRACCQTGPQTRAHTRVAIGCRPPIGIDDVERVTGSPSNAVGRTISPNYQCPTFSRNSGRCSWASASSAVEVRAASRTRFASSCAVKSPCRRSEAWMNP
jgi:hypothetical protein